MTAAARHAGHRKSTTYLAGGLLFAVVGVICFSVRPIFIKLAYAYVVDPVTLLALRMAFSVPFFIVAALWTRRDGRRGRLTRRDIAAIAALGLLSYYAASFLDFLGLQYISAGLGRLLQFIYPTLVVLLSALFLGKRPTRRDIAALLLTYFGLLLVFWHALGGEQRNLWLGAVFIFASATCYATYLVAGSEVIARVGSARFTAYAMIVASAACIAQFIALRPLSALDLPLPVYGWAAAMAIGSTVIPGFLVSEALRRIGANRVAIIGALGPVTAIALGYLGLDEIMTPLQIIGAAFVLLGVIVVSLRPQPAGGKSQ
ncbi:MAG TPA: DMT family transporter [Burkholderiales bacterium]|nr:DMT family transporter [Burkholderiales bacterium]